MSSYVRSPLAFNPSTFNLKCWLKFSMLYLTVYMYVSKLARFYLRRVTVVHVSMMDFCIINLKSISTTGFLSSMCLLDSATIFRCTVSVMKLVRQWKIWTEFCDWRVCWTMKFCMFSYMYSTVSLPYYVMIFLGVPPESLIMMIFSSASIHPACFVLSDSFSLKRLMGFYYPSKSSGIFMIAQLKSFITVVEV